MEPRIGRLTLRTLERNGYWLTYQIATREEMDDLHIGRNETIDLWEETSIVSVRVMSRNAKPSLIGPRDFEMYLSECEPFDDDDDDDDDDDAFDAEKHFGPYWDYSE